MPTSEHKDPAADPATDEPASSSMRHSAKLSTDVLLLLMALSLAIGGCGWFSDSSTAGEETDEPSQELSKPSDDVQWHYKLGAEPLP